MMPHFESPSEPAIRPIDARRCELLEPLIYFSAVPTESSIVGRIEIESGFITDFASIPRLLWRILPPWDIHRRAAIVHDFLYARQSTDRKTADRVFLEAMEVLRVPWWKRRTMYAGVRIGGWVAWGEHKRKAEQKEVTV